MRLAMFIVLATTSLAAGCGPTCQSTCRRMYGTNQCQVVLPFAPNADPVNDCTRICQGAMEVPGDPVERNDARFNPLTQYNGSNTSLANEREAVAWMECVWSFDDAECDVRLQAQYCALIYE